jgi:hypothetical protein
MKTHKFLFPFYKPQDKLTPALLRGYKKCKIVYLHPEEHSKIIEDSKLVLELEEILRKNKSYLEIWLGNFEDNDNRIKNISNDIERISVVNWPTHLLNLVCNSFSNNLVSSYEKNIDYLFLSLNRRPSYHKCYLIDKIYQRQLNNYGKISWLNYVNVNKKMFKFKHFNGKTLILNNDASQDNYPWHAGVRTTLYKNCLFDVVTESEPEVKDISEKTWFSILYEKPNIVLGHTGFHKRLQSFGFELYDEVFNYDFDTNPDMKTRANKILDNIEKYKNEDYIEIYNMLLPKIKRNKQVIKNVVRDTSFIPKKLAYYKTKFSKEYPLLDQYYKISKVTPKW